MGEIARIDKHEKKENSNNYGNGIAKKLYILFFKFYIWARRDCLQPQPNQFLLYKWILLILPTSARSLIKEQLHTRYNR